MQPGMFLCTLVVYRVLMHFIHLRLGQWYNRLLMHFIYILDRASGITEFLCTLYTLDSVTGIEFLCPLYILDGPVVYRDLMHFILGQWYRVLMHFIHLRWVSGIIEFLCTLYILDGPVVYRDLMHFIHLRSGQWYRVLMHFIHLRWASGISYALYTS